MLQGLPQGAQILLIRMSALGDVLFALETLASLKHERPDLQVDFLVDDRFGSLLQGHPQIANLLVFPRHSILRMPGFLAGLRRRRYAALLDLHGILKSAITVFCARASRKLGYAPPGAREGAQRFYSEAIPLPEPLPHRAERGFYLLRALGLRALPARPVLPGAQPAADLWQQGAGPRVILHPGTSPFAAFKRWPAARYAELAGRLAARGCQVVISHGPGEAELAGRVRADAGATRCLDGGQLGLLGLAASYAQADLVIAADTGPLHLAASAGTKVIALFGPKDSKLYGPRGEGHRVLSHKVPCRPCTRRSCPSPQCVLGIDVAEVERTVQETLGL